MTEAANLSPSLSTQLAVLAASEAEQVQAEHCAARLAVDCLPPGSDYRRLGTVAMVLLCAADGLSLCQTGAAAPGPVRVDFVTGAVAHRRRYGGGTGQQIAKAVGIGSGIRPRVVDATAGLGRDAFVLATLGCEVTLMERSPLIALLLEDGLRRAAAEPELADICARLHFQPGDAITQLQQLANTDKAPQVVYLDPMFPHRQKSAEVKKEMRLFRPVVGDDEDAAQLLSRALQAAHNRVVVKRPRKAPALEGRAPSYTLEGKSGRFDIYTLKKLG